MLQYPLASSTWDDKEIAAIQEVIASDRYTMGPRVRAFEEKFAAFFGARYAVMVNSGSSANLLLIAALRYRRAKVLCPGNEVLVPAVSWSTTYYPLHQYGLKMKFVDVDLDTFNLDLTKLEAAVGPRTKAIFAVNLLGAPNDFARLKTFCERHNLLLFEDNCESMGAKFEGRFTGTFGECGTFSTFFSHHISTMEGGVVVTDDEETYQVLISLRAHGWTRELPDQNFVHDKSGDPFEDSFRFVLPGYNVRPLEISGAIGEHQLDKLPALLQARRDNAKIYNQLFNDVPYASIQRSPGDSSWFGFGFVLRGSLAGQRARVTRRLHECGIECRPIVAGNFAKNPVIRHLDHEIHGELKNAENIDRNGFFVGNHHYDVSAGLHLLRDTLDSLAAESGDGP